MVTTVLRQSELNAGLDGPELYLNRELSLLEFQRRVLEEARECDNPTLERVKFLAILGSNLDEFYMVRVAALKQQVASGIAELSLDGRTPTEQLCAIRDKVIGLSDLAYACWHDELIPALAAEGIQVVHHSSLTTEEQETLKDYFRRTLYPVLTPLGFDPGRPFPHISSLSVNLAIRLKDAQGQTRFARVKVPDSLPQLVIVSAQKQASSIASQARDSLPHKCVWLEEVITANLSELFPGAEIIEAHPFRVTRDAEVSIQELESEDLLETIEEAVWRRRFRQVVRLELAENLTPELLSTLQQNLSVEKDDIYRCRGPLSLARLWQLLGLDVPRLKYKAFAPVAPPSLNIDPKEDFFAIIRGGDQLLHHPFESFAPVVDFLRAAARDPQVVAVKITLYRVGRKSPIVEALLEAIEEGKQVAALVELTARFDEESNIEWAKALENQGVHVVYGLLGLKVHSKIALVVRHEGDIMRTYVHLGTGNYNPVTARLYTDLSLFTSDEDIGNDAVTLFHRLTGYAENAEYSKLLVAPNGLRHKLAALIEREIGHSHRGDQGRIIAKMNALDDPEMIRLLYRASQASVQIDLLVRGICCLRPGVPGLSDNIRVTSIVGRFLEHSRIYWFRNGGNEEVYIGSADVMTRNLDKRIEVMFPIRDPKLVRRLKDEILETYLHDNVNAHLQQPDGSYQLRHAEDSTKRLDSQAHFIDLAAHSKTHR